MSTRTARKSKGVYGKWTVEDMGKAMEAYNSLGISLREAAKRYSVPKSTLKRRLLRKNKYATGCDFVIGRQPDLPPEVEEDLVNHVLRLERMFYGVTRQGLMKLAYDIAAKNNLQTRFNHFTKSAGKEWYAGFIKRHPNLSLRTPEATSLARAAGFNKTVVGAFFDVYETIIKENKITPDRLFNADETSHTVVQKPQKVIALKGKHQVGAITSCERGQNVTGMYAMSATGVFIPPMLIYARKRMKENLVVGAPPGTIFRCQDKGWMDTEGFYYWLKHFIEYARPSKERKVLLVLDGHSSHTQSMKAIDLARDHGVIMLSFPSHCTHKMQPLDVGFFKPLNTYFSSAITSRLHEFPGKALNVDAISALVGKAYPRAATMETAINSFRKTGLWPPDRHVFTDADFAAAEVSERPLETHNFEEITDEINIQRPNDQESKSAEAYVRDCSTPLPSEEPLPSTTSQSIVQYIKPSFRLEKEIVSDEDSDDSSKEISISTPTVEAKTYHLVETISPLPSTSGKVLNPRRKKKFNASGVILTATPYKNQLNIQQTPKTKQDAKKIKMAKRNLGASEANQRTEKEINENTNSGGRKYHLDTSKTECIVCGHDYDEDWIMCQTCHEWAHEACADLTDINYYYCDHCKV